MVITFRLVYSQTCSSDQLFKMTTHLKVPMLSLTKQIPIQLLLYKTTTCLTQRRDHFFCLSNEKSLSKITPTKFSLPSKAIGNKHKVTMHKNKHLSDYTLLYCYLIMQSLFNTYKNQTIY